MRIVSINPVITGSTGKIMLNIADTIRKNGGEVYTFSECRRNMSVPEGHNVFGNFAENLFHRGFSVLTGISGMGSRIGTKKLLRELDKISPDIIHLHNLHGWYINIPMLFNYIRKNKIKTVWTLHDCWGFTAQCSHFTIEKCDKWKTGCYSCPRYRLYPYTWVDRTRKMYTLKKKWFTGIDCLTIVTPSEWLADLAKQSFLKEYPVKVINNGIDLEIFKPTSSNFREENNLSGKKIVLGVASGWNYRKGLDVFIKICNRLDPDIYQIILVGTNDEVDKRLPNQIMSIHRTHNQIELAKIYTVADVFVNPTREENYPTVNMEAIACGTPTITFNTGGSGEMLEKNTGAIVDVEDLDEMTRQIKRICEEKSFSESECVESAKKFKMQEKFSEYFKLYTEIMCTDGELNQ